VPAVRLVVIGASWGGLKAVGDVLAGLSADLSAAVVVAQHRAAAGEGELVHALSRRSALPVVEVDDKDEIVPGRVFVAPADYHLYVASGHFVLSTDAPVQFSRPSIDVLFDSAADAYRGGVVAVVLTGANEDGAAGVQHVKAMGGVVLVQDPDDAERREMPQAAVKTGAADRVLSLADLPQAINELCEGR
jgi:two-component system chemotaxis response regulator CheB